MSDTHTCRTDSGSRTSLRQTAECTFVVLRLNRTDATMRDGLLSLFKVCAVLHHLCYRPRSSGVPMPRRDVPVIDSEHNGDHVTLTQTAQLIYACISYNMLGTPKTREWKTRESEKYGKRRFQKCVSNCID